MNLKDMLQEVDKRVSDKILEHIFSKAINLHANNEWRSCDCSYCSTKREATKNIGLINYTQNMLPKPQSNNVSIIDPKTLLPISNPKITSDPDFYMSAKDFLENRKETMRNDLRNKYRKLLSEYKKNI